LFLHIPLFSSVISQWHFITTCFFPFIEVVLLTNFQQQLHSESPLPWQSGANRIHAKTGVACLSLNCHQHHCSFLFFGMLEGACTMSLPGGANQMSDFKDDDDSTPFLLVSLLMQLAKAIINNCLAAPRPFHCAHVNWISFRCFFIIVTCSSFRWSATKLVC